MEQVEVSDELYKMIYAQVQYDIRMDVYAKLHTHIQMLANENNVVVQPHRYPCMTISKFVEVIRNKYKR